MRQVAIRSESRDRHLRHLAAEFGVGDETIRTVLRQQASPLAEMSWPRWWFLEAI